MTRKLFFLLIVSNLWSQGVHPISGRQIAGVMGFEGAPWLERPERMAEEKPDLAVELLDLKPGMTVADIGAGSGYYSVLMSKKIGPSGTVYANDIQPQMLELIKKKNVANVVTVLGAVDDPKLPKACCDLLLMVDVYHELSEPQKMLRRMHEELKPGGRLVLLEYRAEDPKVPIKPEHKMTVAVAKLEVEAEGYKLDTVIEKLPWQHIIIFKAVSTPAAK
jgi:ubiquinone/menaquinone biosynthesis C-methylase UbiE